MAQFGIALLFIPLIGNFGFSFECPMQCHTPSTGYLCCVRDNAICCQGSDGMEPCSIDKPRGPIEKVFVKACSMASLTQALLVNISNHPIKHFQIENVRINSIGKEPFRHLPELTTLILAHTYVHNITDLNRALRSVQGTENVSITLRNFGIRDAELQTLFSDSVVSNIVHLDLEDNEIDTLPLDVLQTWPKLNSVNLNFNKIYTVSHGAMKQLNSLSLSGNRLATSSAWLNLNVGSLPVLAFLNLANNGITSLDVFNWKLVPTLIKLDLHSNQIQFLNYTALQPLSTLEVLDISWNWLSNRTYDTPINSLKTINLAHNQFSIFSPWFCSANGTAISRNLEHIDLSHNLVRYPIRQAWHCLNKLTVLNLTSNPIVKLRNNTFVDLLRLETLVLRNNMNGGGLEYIETAAFNNTSLRYLDLGWNRIVFKDNLHMLDIFKYTENLKMLNLSYNKIGGLNESFMTTLLSPLRKIETLILANCALYWLPPGLLKNLTQIKVLDLDKNKIHSNVLKSSFEGAIELKNLSMYMNYIRVIKNDSFPGISIKNLKYLNLAGNPFACTCDNRWFFRIIQNYTGYTNGVRLADWPNKYTCRTPDALEGISLKNFHLDERKCDPPNNVNGIVIAFIAIGSFLLVFSVTTAIVYRFRWHITYWRYKMVRKKTPTQDAEEQPLLKDKPTYDVCSIYSQRDERLGRFLTNDFLPTMVKLDYDVFIWDRDAGCGSTVSEIADAIYGSRNAIAIITNDFLNDPWCLFQIEVALDHEIELQRDFLTIVAHEEVDYKLLSKFWCVRFTKTPTVQWYSGISEIRKRALEEFIINRLGEPVTKDYLLSCQRE